MLGYKIMRLNGDRLYSLADDRYSIPLQKGHVSEFPGGIFLGSTIEFVQQYYGSVDVEDPDEWDAPDREARCTFEYETASVIKKGTSGMIDAGHEILVSRCILVGVSNVSDKIVLF